MLGRSRIGLCKLQLAIIEPESLASVDAIPGLSDPSIDEQPAFGDPALDLTTRTQTGVCEQFLNALRQVRSTLQRIPRAARAAPSSSHPSAQHRRRQNALQRLLLPPAGPR